MELGTRVRPDWCPGCGNFGIETAVRDVLVELGLSRESTVLVSGIGCHGKFPHFFDTYGYESIHGRALPVAQAIKLANHDLNVLVDVGDGDCYGIGMGHFVHAMRRNVDLTVLIHDNRIYGLTTGQASPTTVLGQLTKSTPHGVGEVPVNPLSLALSSGAGFVARAYPARLEEFKAVLKAAIAYRGLSVIDVLQPCVTFNKGYGYSFYSPKVYSLQEERHDTKDFNAAMSKALEADRIPLGVFYNFERPTYEDYLPQMKGEAMVKREGKVDVEGLMGELV